MSATKETPRAAYERENGRMHDGPVPEKVRKFSIMKCRRCGQTLDEAPTCRCGDPLPVEVDFVAIGPMAWGRGKDPTIAVKNAKKEISRAYVKKPYTIRVYEVWEFEGISDMDGGIHYKGDVKPVLVRVLVNQRPPDGLTRVTCSGR